MPTRSTLNKLVMQCDISNIVSVLVYVVTYTRLMTFKIFTKYISMQYLFCPLFNGDV